MSKRTDTQFVNHINIMELFVETHQEVYNKNKINKDGKNIKRKYEIQERYLELLSFVKNSCYWSRFNFDFKSYKYKKGTISGKYLNEIHNKLVEYGFYEDFYRKLMNIYLKLTNYETLETVSQDSAFFRNILAKNCKRNPQYYNKSGLKIHSIVDTNRVPISIEITECTDHDSQYIESGLQHLYLDDENFYNNCRTYLADSAYNTDINTFSVTNKGINVIMGRNKQHIKKGTDISTAPDAHRKKYKKRGLVENFFGCVERYPCILNVYEKKDHLIKVLLYSWHV